jgi:transcriptional regulator with XRE-family HTH domain
MKNIVNQNIKKLVAILNISALQFAKTLGYERADTIYNLLNDKTGPSVGLIQSIANVYENISLRWLLTGKGQMFITEHQSGVVNEERQEYLSRNHIANNSINISNLSSEGLRLYYENQYLKQRIEMLNARLLDKDKIIKLLEGQINN